MRMMIPLIFGLFCACGSDAPAAGSGSADAGAQDGSTAVDEASGDASTGDTTAGDTTAGDTTAGDGAAQDAGPVVIPKVFLNEVVAKGVAGSPGNATGSDWIELYNAEDAAVSLAGFKIIDSGQKTAEYAFPLPPGTSIAAKGYLVVFFNHDGAGSPVIDKGLGADEAATLFHPSGAVVDRVNWEDGDAPEGKSWGRLPDGSAMFSTMAVPTLGAANK